MARELKLFNGRLFLREEDRGDGNPQGKGYIAAYSKADAARLLAEYVGHSRGHLHEINVYWSKGHWGNSMADVKPERGLWVARSSGMEKPRRVI